VSELAPPRTSDPVERSPAVARKNIVLGLALAGVSLLIAAGAVIVSLIYLHFD